ncbi:hypothetical protein L2E82_12643 [Cichorium intybus]|uniref:Uncharacterized protein n=1 Tax=Cichorium intybus TaxID=13427 RepID=A0ACB9GIL7_CICIN|nr:hypothetical protein L2E82_12643 [Cichorium intybus]
MKLHLRSRYYRLRHDNTGFTLICQASLRSVVRRRCILAFFQDLLTLVFVLLISVAPCEFWCCLFKSACFLLQNIEFRFCSDLIYIFVVRDLSVVGSDSDLIISTTFFYDSRHYHIKTP